MPSRKAVIWTLVLVAGATLGRPAAHSARGTDNYLLLYSEGLRAFDFEKWGDAAMLLSAATKLQPNEGEWVRLYGMRWEPYLPYYHSAVALANLNRFSAALKQIEESLRQGAISEKKNRRWLERMLKLRDEIDDRARERASELIEDASAAQEQLARLQEEQGEAAPELASVATSLEASTSEMAEGEASVEAVTSLEESVGDAWRELAAAAERGRQARKKERLERERAEAESYRRDVDAAGKLAAAPGCQREALSRLEELQEPPPRAVPSEAPLLLARELGECGDYTPARQYLALARQGGALSDDELAAELEHIRAAEASAVLQSLRAAVTTEECRSRELQALSGYVERGLLAPARAALLRAAGQVACGEVALAREALAAAQDAGAPADELAPVRQAVERAEAQLEAIRRSEALAERVRELRQRLAAEICAPDAAIELGALLATADGAGDDEAEDPAVLLATEYVECGELERARRVLDKVAPAVRASAAAAALSERINSLDAVRRQRLRRLELVGSYAEADARVRLGECDPRIFEILDATEASMADDTQLLARLERAVRPLPLVRGLALMNCNRRSEASRLVEVSPAFDEESAATRSLRRWLQAEQALEQYTGSYALLLGMSNYEPSTGWPRLPGVEDDIAAVAAVLEQQGFTVERAMDLPFAEFDQRIRQFISDHGLEPTNRLVFYYAGHGWTGFNKEIDYQLGYVVPVDAPAPARDEIALLSLVSMNTFEWYAKEIRARHVAFFFDSCFSGTVFDATKSLLASEAELSNVENLHDPVRLFITAGDADQQVPDESSFRRALVEALSGQADSNTDGLIMGSELGFFIHSAGASPLNTPQWGRIELPSFNRGDLGFRSPSLRTGTLAPPSQQARLRAELEDWTSIVGREDLEDLERFTERYPQGLITRGLSVLGAGGAASTGPAG